MDRQGKPVVVYVDRALVNSVTTPTLKLRRWNGSAWETVGSDIVLGTATCEATSGAGLGFDSGNDPIVSYVTIAGDGTASVSVHRYSGGAWNPLGPNNGVLPLPVADGGQCESPTNVLVGADDAPRGGIFLDRGRLHSTL